MTGQNNLDYKWGSFSVIWMIDQYVIIVDEFRI